ncbi:dolichyl-phosphate-mannose--protein mannosyltransferase [Pengzhenrongella sicca]|uniref:Polyprenol-phosphate-mannose--protein mannosyltransferase n=1 Tax=Pengzhenrongella sicca TaxID=2819238 RepID=A0A8A4ZKV7_9MICO|nr:phospholipid carrier-dependent glycosyltransferase [Pengzhenrongella sicca]QTE31589.1 phospholipid carrier-dependent glycosyltransferase [Pengzhenrongella sicca]
MSAGGPQGWRAPGGGRHRAELGADAPEPGPLDPAAPEPAPLDPQVLLDTADAPSAAAPPPEAEPAPASEPALEPEPAPEPAPAPEPTEARLLRRLLGDAALLLGSTRRDRIWGWIGPLLVTALAALARFPGLGRPHTLIFDETYYVKQAYTLLKVGYEARWPDDANAAFEAGNLDTFLARADYAVHPPVGKWMIALGMELAGPASSAGWRLSAAVCGTLAVLMLARIARRLFASTLLGTIAGGLLAVDGLAIVHSRTGLLDGFLMFFVLAGFGALLLDREQARRRLARLVAARQDAGLALTEWGPRLGIRWWRVAAGVLLGLAIGTKWSGLYFLAVFGLLTVAWDVSARRAAGVRLWLAAGLLRDGVPAALTLVPLAAATYLVSWIGWLRTPAAYLRTWAATNPGEGISWLPESLRSLAHYHAEMWEFHTHLTAEHAYAAHPLGWLIQWRPTSFFYEAPVPAQALCGADRCSQAITSLGNPILWWAATAALVAVVWWFVRTRDWRAAAALSGILAGWVPWLAYSHRTIFTFYSIAFAPWMVLVLTYALGRVLGTPADDPVRRRRGALWVGGFLGLVVLVSAFFYPIWTAQVVPYTFWHLHMWLASWV